MHSHYTSSTFDSYSFALLSVKMVANTEPAGYQAASALKFAEPTSNKPIQAKPSGPNKLFANPGTTFGDWRDDLYRDGFAVIKGAIPLERAERYGDEMLSYLETL